MSSIDKFKKISGPTYWVMMMVALTDDVFDLLGNMALLVPFVGLVFSTVIFVISLIFGLTIFAYLKSKGVTFGGKILRRIIISIAIELIPLLSMLPATTFALVTIRAIHNNKTARKITKVIDLAHERGVI